jgi:hypothetical protein
VFLCLCSCEFLRRWWVENSWALNLILMIVQTCRSCCSLEWNAVWSEAALFTSLFTLLRILDRWFTWVHFWIEQGNASYWRSSCAFVACPCWFSMVKRMPNCVLMVHNRHQAPAAWCEIPSVLLNFSFWFVVARRRSYILTSYMGFLLCSVLDWSHGCTKCKMLFVFLHHPARLTGSILLQLSAAWEV